MPDPGTTARYVLAPAWRAGCAFVLLTATGCTPPPRPTVVQVLPAPPTRSAPPLPGALHLPGAHTRAEMRRVDLRLDPVLTLHIERLLGELFSSDSAAVVSFDDPGSFTLAIADATVTIDTVSLARLMNHYVFAYPGAPLTDFAFGVIGDSLLRVRGKLHRALPVFLDIGARARATPEGLIRITPVDIALGPLHVKWLMKALGLTLDGLIDVRRAAGVRLDGNDLLLSPERMLPPPDITGRLETMAMPPAGLTLWFKDSSLLDALGPAAADTAAGNYMAFRHGTLRFGKLFMVDADMRVVDQRPADPFDFFLAQYSRQLEAGTARVGMDGGLVVRMPDYRRLVERALKTGT